MRGSSTKIGPSDVPADKPATVSNNFRAVLARHQRSSSSWNTRLFR